MNHPQPPPDLESELARRRRGPYEPAAAGRRAGKLRNCRFPGAYPFTRGGRPDATRPGPFGREIRWAP